jgi:nitroimidazol reductase NimA-like FMN-containing flavoprotein (pyridoxamine 5'-phosphate oxidase superfamily)
MPRNYDLDKNTPTAHQRLPEYGRDDEWIRAFLQRGQIAHIASRWDVQPFIIPTNFFYDQPGHRLIFHSNIAGRIRANIERHPEVCAEVSEMGKLLPSNIALEFSLQYRSVLVFGKAYLIEDRNEQREVLHKLIAKYFGDMQIDKDYRPATDKELRQTSVYEIRIESWSGKENWKDRADQSDEWPALNEKWFGESFP